MMMEDDGCRDADMVGGGNGPFRMGGCLGVGFITSQFICKEQT